MSHFQPAIDALLYVIILRDSVTTTSLNVHSLNLKMSGKLTFIQDYAVLPSKDNIYDSGQDYNTEKAWEPVTGVADLSRFYS